MAYVTEEENPSGTRGCGGCMKRCWDLLQRNAFVLSCLAAVAVGIVMGLILKFYADLSEKDRIYIGFPGEMLLRMLEMITVPLIVSSVITSFPGPRVGIPGKVVARASAYFVSTSFLSMILGLILVLSIKPGVNTVRKKNRDGNFLSSFVEALMDLAWNIAPENLIMACFRHYKTEMVVYKPGTVYEKRYILETNTTQLQPVHHVVHGTNVLGLIVWSFIFGLVLNRMGTRTEFFLEAVTVLNEATKHAVNLITCYVPFGLVFMVASIVLVINDWEIFFKLGKFMGVVVFGHVIHGIIVLPLIYFLCVRLNPYAVIKGVFPALMTAFVSSSSSATLPLTFKCCEERLQINNIISRFMLPIEVNINMDGTVLYEVVAAAFVAQLNNINLDLNQCITIAMTSAVSSVGAAGIPARGAVTTFFVLTAVGLRAKEACLFVVLECLLDRFNTVVNVLGDCFGVALIHQVFKRDLEHTEQGQEMKRINGSDAETQTTDEIQIHICSHASHDDTLNTPPKNPSFQHSDAEESIQDKDQLIKIVLTPPEYSFELDQDSIGDKINGNDAEAQTTDEIQIHICSQASDDDTLNTPPKNPSFQHSDAEEPIQDKDQTKEDFSLEILLTAPEYTLDQDSIGDKINGNDAEIQTTDEIQVHICSQASDNDTLNTPPKNPSFQHSDAEEPIQDKDQTKEDFSLEILLTAPEYTLDQDSIGDK